jgi:hypothetical protein
MTRSRTTSGARRRRHVGLPGSVGITVARRILIERAALELGRTLEELLTAVGAGDA